MLSLLSVKGVPVLPWSSSRPFNLRPRMVTLAFLVLGLMIFGLGEGLLIGAGIGVSPWTVLAQGVSQVTALSIGGATFVVSAIVLGLWWPLRQTPGVGTVLNAIIIAAILEFTLPFMPTPDAAILQLGQALAGIMLVGFGSGIYLAANLGPGPRDGLMTGLQRLTGLPIAWVRSGIEVAVVVAGWSLGGVVGIGTLMFAFLIGPAVAISLRLLSVIYADNDKL